MNKNLFISLDEGYRALAADEQDAAEASEWIDGTIECAADEAR